MYEHYSPLGRRLAVYLKNGIFWQDDYPITIELVDEFLDPSFKTCKRCKLSLYCLIETIPKRRINGRYLCFAKNNTINFFEGQIWHMSFTRSNRSFMGCSNMWYVANRAICRECFIAIKENFEELNLTEKKIENIIEQFVDQQSMQLRIYV